MKNRADLRIKEDSGGIVLLWRRKRITSGDGITVSVEGGGAGIPHGMISWNKKGGEGYFGTAKAGGLRLEIQLRQGPGGIAGAIAIKSAQRIRLDGISLTVSLIPDYDAWRIGPDGVRSSCLLDPSLYGKKYHKDFLEFQTTGYFDPPKETMEDILVLMKAKEGRSVECLSFSPRFPRVRLMAGMGWDYGLVLQDVGGTRRLRLDSHKWRREPRVLEEGEEIELSFSLDARGAAKGELRELVRSHRDLLGAADEAEAAYQGPSVVQVGPTNRCNLFCLPCWCHSPRHRMPDYERWSRITMPFEKFREAAEALAAMGTRSIFLIGKGEPLLHPEIVDMVSLVNSLGMSSYIISNGTTLSPALVDRLLEAGLNKLGLSLWAATPETYLRLHPARSADTFHRIESALAYLAGKKRNDTGFSLHLEIINVMSSLNCGEEKAMIDFARKYCFDSVYFRPVCIPTEESLSLLMTPEQREKHMAELEELSREMEGEPWIYHNIGAYLDELRAEGGEEGRYRGMRHINRCMMGYHYMVLGPGGDLSPCPHGTPLVEIPGKRTLEEVWAGEEMAEFRRRSTSLEQNMDYFSRLGYSCLSECCLVPNNELMWRGVQRVRSLTARRRTFRKAARKVKRESSRVPRTHTI